MHLYAKVDGKEFILAYFEKNKSEQAYLDLYFRVEQKVEFGVRGKGDVHLSGYIEDEGESPHQSEEEESEHLSEEEEVEQKKPKP